MIRKTRGIILHTTRFGESSLVVHCYTEQYGRQTYMVKGVRKSRKTNRSNLFQPLFILDFEVYHKESRDMQLVKEVSRPFPLNSLPYELTKSTQAIFIAEVLYRVVREEEPNPVLFQFLLHSIQYIDAMEEAAPDFHIVFLFQLSRHLGFFPQNNKDAGHRSFDLGSGRFEGYVRDPELELDSELSDLWCSYIESDYKNMEALESAGTRRQEILEFLVKYYQLHVDGMGRIRSLEVLHDFFHN